MRILTYSPHIRVLWVVALILWLLPRASTAQCLATRTIAEGASVTATTTGAATAPYSTLYVLTDNSGVVADQNATGNFTIATAGSYRIYVLNYDTGNVPTGVPPTAGSNISAITGGCFNSGDFASEYLCVVVNSANCIATRTICQGDALTVSAAGNNSTAGYATLFVLVDNATGLVVASNSTGDFTSSVSGGNSYTILTLNYDTANPPAPLPVNAGDDPSTIGSTTMGCYNTDFLTEQLCVTVDNCASGCVATRTISQGDPLSVSTTGNNTTVGYSTVFVLADAVTGIVVSSNTTGVFTNDVTCGESYAILTLNYDTANPPSPLPINAGDDVTTIGSTTAGCYNSDFLTAFLCVNVNPCTNCLATRTICQGDAVQVSTTGDNTTPGYVTVYILANSSNDQVVASNSTGTFTNDVTSGNSYYIVTLNYNASNPPVPLAINPGDNVTGMGDSSPGCYNSDLLTERLCLTVNTCCTANAGDIDQVEMCQGAAAPSDLTPLTPSYGGGFGPAPNPAADYSYAYFLTADAAPNAILQGPVATANLFTYNTLAAGTYRVYGFSYRTVQGPLTNTTAGSPILGVGLTGGTCYEATFTNLVVNPIPAPPTLSDAVYCTGQAAAALDATTSGAVSYSWSDASTAPTLTPSTATAAVTIYAVTVTGTGGCTATQDAQITVNQTPTPTITPSGPTTLCAPATVDLTASGGGTYAWSTGAATATITASASGTYTVTVTNNGCTATASQVVTVNSATASITPSGPTTFCTGGSVVLVANGGGTYAWSTGEATQSITASATGTYTVTVTSTGGCTATASQAVTVNSTTASITPSGPTTLCAPATVDLTASGGGTYAWSTGAATATITASASGTYTVTVTNNGCTATASQTVTVNSATASITPSGPTTFCTGGSVVLVANGGGTYAWSTGAVTQSITASTTGTYTVTVTSTGGCTATASQAVTVNPLPAIASVTAAPSTVCPGSSTQLTTTVTPLTQTVSGGGSVTIPTSGNGTPYPATLAVSGVPVSATVQSVTLSGLSHTFPNDMDIYLQSPTGTNVILISDVGTGADIVGGTITLQMGAPAWVSGPLVSGTYSPTDISPGDIVFPPGSTTNLATFTGDPNGTWNLFVSDDVGGDSGSLASWSITFNLPLSVNYAWSANPASETAGISNTTISNPTATVNQSATYTVTVTDSGTGCSSTGSVAVTVPIVTATIVANGPTTICPGSSVILTANGGTSYLWSNAATTQSIEVNAAGAYTVTVTDATGCTATASQSVVLSTPPLLTGVTASPSTFCGTGTTQLDVVPAALPPTQTVSGGGSVTIPTSGNGTPYPATLAVSGVPAGATVQSVTLSGLSHTFPNDMDIYLQSPTGTNVILISDVGTGADIVGGTITLQMGAPAWVSGPLVSGTYSPTDISPGDIVFPPGSTTNLATFTGDPNGTWNLFVSDDVGGDSGSLASWSITFANPVYTYTWSANPASETAGISNTSISNPTAVVTQTATYTVTVTDGAGCSSTANTTVTVNPAPTATITPSGPTTFCAGGSVVLVANGGGTYAWSTGAVTQSITASATGTYTVTVTNTGGCTATASQAVTVNSATASITPSGPTTLCAPATVDLTASGGGTYAWSTGAATATITASASGTYTVTVTNNGCTATASQSVTVNSATASITPSGPTTFCTGGSVVLVATGGGSYAWSTGEATQSITASATGTYTVTVTGAGGCTATASQAVTANNAPTADAGADQSICSGQSATLTATGGGTYLWSTGEATASINVSPASATIYTVTVTGVGGCTASDAVSVAVSTTPTATASNNGPVCDTRDIILSASGGSTYAWSGPNGFSSTSQTSVILSGSPQFPGVGTWTYTVTVTNGTCSATASTTITVNASPSITASSNSPVCAGSTLQLTSNYSNPTGGDIYAWAGPNGFSSSQANPTISNVSILNGGVYTLTVANQFSCTSSTTTTVTIANTPNANITSNVVCNGGIATVNLLVASAGGGSTYAWSGTGATGTGNSQTIVGLAPGLQIYTVTITTVSGCTASSTTTINVPSCFVCDAAAGTVSVSNGCVGSPLATSVSGNNTTAGYTTQFIVTNTAGTIVYIGAAPINGLAAGNYLLHSYNYSVQPTPAPAVGGSIADYVTNTNNTGCYDVSNGMAFTVAAAAPALVGTSSLSQGNGGGTSPFYYNIEVLTVEGGTIPYDFEWDNTGYVRYDIAYGDADGDGIGDATITVYYSDNAYWNVTVTDAGACGNSTPVIFTNEPGAGTDLLLDITNYVITAQSGTTNNGAVNITVSGGGAGCTPYSYAWSGPNGFTATTEDISSLEYGWYSVTVTCADGSENTVGWYWVPRNRRGRSKTDGDMIGLAAMPNPFNSQTNIEFYVSQDAHTTVSVFAADGKRVAVLFSDRAVADEVYSVSLDGGSLPAGVYTVVMNTDTGEVQTYKVILTK